MVVAVLPGFAHSVSVELTEFQQVLLRDGLSFQDSRRVECVARLLQGHDWLRCLMFVCYKETRWFRDTDRDTDRDTGARHPPQVRQEATQ